MFNSVRGGIERFSDSVAKYNGDIEFVQYDCPPTLENVEKLKGCEAFLFSPFKTDGEEFWKRISEVGVKYVVTCSAGYDHFDLAAMKKYGLKAANVPFYSPNAISEHAVLLLLASLRHLRKQLMNVAVGDYALDGLMGQEVRNQTIGIVGAGRIGYTTMKCLSGFGPKKLYACDPHENDAVKELAEYVSYEEICAKCDVIIFHCVYNEANHHMVNADTLKHMKDGVVLINVARGPLFDIEAVYDAVCSGKIGALALDVIEGEEILRRPKGQNDLPILDKLLEHDNVTFTMHTAFYTDEADRNQSDTTLANFNEYRTTGECRFELVK